MKKTIILLLSLILILSTSTACAYGSYNTASDGKNILPDKDATQTAPTESESSDTVTGNDDTAPDGTDGESTASDPFDTALSLIDHPVSELYAAIGEPWDKSYASSCMGSGQDGELYYDGFIVCTYLEGERETVVDVYRLELTY